jgi:hypothetical protein
MDIQREPATAMSCAGSYLVVEIDPGKKESYLCREAHTNIGLSAPTLFVDNLD